MTRVLPIAITKDPTKRAIIEKIKGVFILLLFRNLNKKYKDIMGNIDKCTALAKMNRMYLFNPLKLTA